MQSASLIVTPLWTSICKPMNWIEVSSIGGFHTDLCKNVLGEGPQTPLFQHNSARLSTINTLQKSLYCIYHVYNEKTCSIPWYFYTCTYCLILRLWTFFFFFFFFFFCFSLFRKKWCPPPPTFHHWATPLMMSCYKGQIKGIYRIGERRGSALYSHKLN